METKCTHEELVRSLNRALCHLSKLSQSANLKFPDTEMRAALAALAKARGEA